MGDIKIHGFTIDLTDDRSVFLARHEGRCYVRFTNKDKQTKIMLSEEAMDALVKLATKGDERMQFWEIFIPGFDASRDFAIAEDPIRSEGVNND